MSAVLVVLTLELGTAKIVFCFLAPSVSATSLENPTMSSERDAFHLNKVESSSNDVLANFKDSFYSPLNTSEKPTELPGDPDTELDIERAIRYILELENKQAALK
jgi:hypothetical protein